PEAGARYGLFVPLQPGLSRLVEALAGSVGPANIRTQTPIAALARDDQRRWRLTTAAAEIDRLDGVVVAAPAAQAAALLGPLDDELGRQLAGITAAGSVVATLLYRREQIARPLDGFGFVCPRIERRAILAASFPSVKFAGRDDPAWTPVRVFLGGVHDPEAVLRSDQELQHSAASELHQLIGVRGAPEEVLVARWPAAMPQYAVGRSRRLAAIDARAARCEGLELAGNSYGGVGIPQCVRS
ncbi:MAG TPA: FAD-dependent oxidoreductase, partial [Lacipirellulaceae bacterium]|nr:FAD-dependent oxidoreductase [Lacipirellulaceae bacterium]